MWIVGVLWVAGVVLWVSPSAASQFANIIQGIMRLEYDDTPRIIRISAACLVLICSLMFALQMLAEFFPDRAVEPSGGR